jgi:hypothetical protein
MPVIQGLTFEQLRLAVGYNLGAVTLIEADASGSTTTFLTDDLYGGTSDHQGKYIVHIGGGSSNNDGEKRRVISTAISSNRTTLTTFPATTNSSANGHQAELWDQEYDPVRIEAYIDRAIIAATGRAFDPIENTSLHFDGKTRRFDIPSNIAMIKEVMFRRSVKGTTVHACDRIFDEKASQSNFTSAVDDQDSRSGASVKLVIATAASDGDFVIDSIDSVDLSKYTHLEGWVKATTTLAAADFVIRLDNGTVTGDSNDLEILSVPATTAADTWTYFSIALANPETDTAIVSIGLEYNANQVANTVWFDQIQAVVNDSADWAPLPHHLWDIDKEARDLIVKPGGVRVAGYSLMKLLGGDIPVLRTDDSTVNEIDDEYVISQATGLALMAHGGGRATDPDDRRRAAAPWLAIAAQRKRNMPVLTNVRHVI